MMKDSDGPLPCCHVAAKMTWKTAVKSEPIGYSESPVVLIVAKYRSWSIFSKNNFTRSVVVVVVKIFFSVFFFFFKGFELCDCYAL